jgi:hypothetical protein
MYVNEKSFTETLVMDFTHHKICEQYVGQFFIIFGCQTARSVPQCPWSTLQYVITATPDNHAHMCVCVCVCVYMHICSKMKEHTDISQYNLRLKCNNI